VVGTVDALSADVVNSPDEVEQREPGSPVESVELVIRIRAWAKERMWPILITVSLLLVGMAFTLWWNVVVRHVTGWVTPGDLWGTYRSAHYIAWGDIGDVFGRETGLVTLPGISLVLAPIAALTYGLGLTESLPYQIAHPTAWLLLGPAEILIGAIVLFPLDRLAQTLGVSRARRAWLTLAEGVLLFPTTVIWGHPEDALAIAFAALGLLAVLRGDWRSTGWWFGLALVTQPLVVLLVPIAFAMAPMRGWLKMAVRMAFPSVTLAAIPLVTEWSQTSRALFQQPNYPTMDHATPWLALAPVLAKAHTEVVAKVVHLKVHGHLRFVVQHHVQVVGEIVASGPGRTIAIALSLIIGVWVYRHRSTVRPEQLIWAAALALSLRCAFEAVMNPYYLWPPLALILLLSVRTWRRFVACVVVEGLLTVWSYRHTGPWMWWLPTVVMLGVCLALAMPRRGSEAVAELSEPVDSYDAHSDLITTS
jgi:hypothetical protein